MFKGVIQITRRTGMKIWESTEHFNKAFDEFKDIVIAGLDIATDDIIKPYHEIGFNLEKKYII